MGIFDEVPLRQKWENKIGIFPDVQEWDENEPIKLDGQSSKHCRIR